MFLFYRPLFAVLLNNFYNCVKDCNFLKIALPEKNVLNLFENENQCVSHLIISLQKMFFERPIHDGVEIVMFVFSTSVGLKPLTYIDGENFYTFHNF